MKLITKNIKSILIELWHDKDLVNEIKRANVNNEQLYYYLTCGKITLQEYVQSVK
jgi:hypothetical protein